MNINWGPCQGCGVVMVPPPMEGGTGLCVTCSLPSALCQLCHDGNAMRGLPALFTRDTRFPLKVCAACFDTVNLMMIDYPWLRYQVSQYRKVPPGTKNYNIEGEYFGP